MHFKNLGKNILLKNENAKETKLAAKTLYCMSTTLFLAKKMGEGMGRSKVLFSKMQKGS